MANIYPIKEDLSEVPFAELKVYEALEKLGKNFYIFHSVQWLKKTKKWAATWKENDFTKNPTTNFADPPPLKGRLNKKAENVQKNILRFSFLFA